MAEQQQLFLPKTNRGQLVGIDAKVNQVGLGTLGTPLTQRNIVLLRATGIAVPLDSNFQIRVLLMKSALVSIRCTCSPVMLELSNSK
jgi:hypothetical protein